MLSDVRHAVRVSARRPGFTAAAVFTLALGIGANTAIYSVLQAVWIDAVPFPDAGRLALIWSAGDFSRSLQVSVPNFLDWRRETRAFEDLAAIDTQVVFLEGDTSNTPLPANQVSPSLFSLVGVAAHLGRTFTEDDARPDAPRTAVVAYGFWQRHFGGTPDVIGRTLALRDGVVTVVGVAPPDFKVVRAEPALWLPFVPPPDAHRGNTDLAMVIGRLRPGVSLGQARDEMARIARRLVEAYPETNRRTPETSVVGLRDQVVGSGVGESLFLLLGATGLVLLIACTNITTMFLARGADRRQELAVRAALGAGRGRLARLVLTESGLVAMAGAVVGLALMHVTRDALVAVMPSRVPRTDAIGIDWRVVLFTALATAVAALVAGLLPAWRSSAAGARGLGREWAMGATGATARARRLTSLLVAAEVTLSVVVLAAAAVLFGSFVRLTSTSPGFDPAGVITFRARPVASDATPAQVAAQVLEEVRRLPGVTAAAASDAPPLSGARAQSQVTLPERPVPGSGFLSLDVRKVTPGFFQTLRIPMRAGREFTERDNEGAQRVVVVNESAARRLWPGASALDQRIAIARFPEARVVGVAGDVRHQGLSEDPLPEIYVPHAQQPANFPTYVLRSARPAQVLPGSQASAVESALPVRVTDVRTMDELVRRSIHVPRFRTWLFGLLGLLVACLTAVGVFSVTAYVVAQRRREMAIRLALGSRPGQVVRLVLAQAAVPVAAGVMLGLAGAFNTNRLLAHFLYRTSPTEGLTLGAALAAVTVVALLAAAVPALRAARVDPAVILRAE